MRHGLHTPHPARTRRSSRGVDFEGVFSAPMLLPFSLNSLAKPGDPMIRVSRVVMLAMMSAACGRTAAVTNPSPSAANRDWPSYNRTVAGDRFAPLAQIDRSNVASLQSVCT
ncbi:MAG TPA: hypothetical protein VH277_03660 [Gemmatimonadaceae bacterium]|nr:hypothetical protein [Gemmatimonadaceae bacterium]